MKDLGRYRSRIMSGAEFRDALIFGYSSFKFDRVALLALYIAAFAMRIYNIQEPPNPVFDECKTHVILANYSAASAYISRKVDSILTKVLFRYTPACTFIPLTNSWENSSLPLVYILLGNKISLPG